jgi:Protein of unknown function (DUF4446)
VAASSLSSTQGIVAVAAGAVAVVALLVGVWLAVSVRRLRLAQRKVIGEQGEQDLVGHAASLQQAFEELREYAEGVAARIDTRLGGVERELRGTIAKRALVRYDAYNELSGRQSMSIALLDGTQSGLVLSCIHHRDQARVYAKQIHDGLGEIELSPEEAEAVRIAAGAVATGSSPRPAA